MLVFVTELCRCVCLQQFVGACHFSMSFVSFQWASVVLLGLSMQTRIPPLVTGRMILFVLTGVWRMEQRTQKPSLTRVETHRLVWRCWVSCRFVWTHAVAVGVPRTEWKTPTSCVSALFLQVFYAAQFVRSKNLCVAWITKTDQKLTHAQ